MKKMNKPTGTRYWGPGEKGNALILLVLTLPVLLGVAGLVLDWGRGVWTKTTLQKAADSAALAGASELPNALLAEEKAKDFVARNFDSPDDAVFTVNGNEITVELTENVDTFLMRVFGHHTMEVAVSATAIGERVAGALREGAFPIALLNPNLNGDPDDDLEPKNYGRPYIIGYGEANVIVHDWADGADETLTNVGIVGPDDGWRGALRLPTDGVLGGGGTMDLRYNMVNGWAGDMSIGDYLPCETGNLSDAMGDGREDLLGHKPLEWVDFDPEIHATSNRVVLVPIVHLIHETRRDQFTVQDYENGAQWDREEVIIDGFAPFFLLTEKEHDDIIDVHGDTRDWVIGFFVPGVTTNDWGDTGGEDFGLIAPPRLIQ